MCDLVRQFRDSILFYDIIFYSIFISIYWFSRFYFFLSATSHSRRSSLFSCTTTVLTYTLTFSEGGDGCKKNISLFIYWYFLVVLGHTVRFLLVSANVLLGRCQIRQIQSSTRQGPIFPFYKKRTTAILSLLHDFFFLHRSSSLIFLFYFLVINTYVYLQQYY